MVLVLAAPPPAAQALKLAKAKQWEELYLAYSAGKVDEIAKADRAKIAAALAQGCTALQGDDPVMAFSMGDRSVEMAETAGGLYCTALTAKRSDQRGAAEDMLQRGTKAFPKDARFPLELGRLYMEDGQSDEAQAMLARVPPKSKEGLEAKKILKGLVQPLEANTSPRGVDPSPVVLQNSASRSYESSVDDEGRRIRQNQYFRFRYFNSKRDFGQRADYEGAVQASLENARQQAQRLLGAAREKAVDVILYSREEFRMHHGPQFASSVAGFYSSDAIRMNDSAEMNDHNRAVLVHEYVHAVMDELLSFNGRAIPVWMHEGTAEFIEWRSEGHDGAPAPYATRIQQLAIQDQLPKLAQLANGPLINTSNPALNYAVSALAIRLLVERKSMYELLELFRDCGKGMAFPTALERHFGTSVERLDEELQATLKSR